MTPFLLTKLSKNEFEEYKISKEKIEEFIKDLHLY